MQVGPLLRTLVQNSYDTAELETVHDRLSLHKARTKAKEENLPIPQELPARSVSLTPTERLQRLLQKTPPWELHELKGQQHDSWNEPFQQALTDPFCKRWFYRYYPQGVDKPPPFKGTWQEVIERCQPSSFESFHDTLVLQLARPFEHYVATRRFCVVGDGQDLWILSRKKLWRRKLYLSNLAPITAMASYANQVYTGHADGTVCSWNLDQATYLIFRRSEKNGKRPVSYLAVTRSHLYVGLSSDNALDFNKEALLYESDELIRSEKILNLSPIIGIFTYAQRVKKPSLIHPEQMQWVDEKYFIVSTHDGTISCWKASSLIKNVDWKMNLEEGFSLVSGGIFLQNRLLIAGNHDDGYSRLYLIDLESGSSTTYRDYESPIVRLEKIFHLIYCVTTKAAFLIGAGREDQFSIEMGGDILIDEAASNNTASFKFVNYFQGLYVNTAVVQGKTKYQLVLRDFSHQTEVAQPPILPAVITSRKVAALVLACFAALLVVTTCLIPLWKRSWRQG